MTSEGTTITDVIAHGIERIEVIGDYARIVYWHWKFEAGNWRRAIVDVAIVRPLSSFTQPMEQWCACIVHMPAEPEAASTHH